MSTENQISALIERLNDPGPREANYPYSEWIDGNGLMSSTVIDDITVDVVEWIDHRSGKVTGYSVNQADLPDAIDPMTFDCDTPDEVADVIRTILAES